MHRLPARLRAARVHDLIKEVAQWQHPHTWTHGVKLAKINDMGPWQRSKVHHNSGRAGHPKNESTGLEVQELVGWQVSSASVADVVLRLVGADENYNAYLSPSHTGWLADTGLMDALVTQVPGSLPTGCLHTQGGSG